MMVIFRPIRSDSHPNRGPENIDSAPTAAQNVPAVPSPNPRSSTRDVTINVAYTT